MTTMQTQPDRSCSDASPDVRKAGSTLNGWQFGFGEVRHARLRPVRHAFRYRAFFLRVPVHQLDGTRQGNWLFGVNRSALLSFHESDHGQGQCARDWLRAVLHEAGITADGELWLHTFPRVFGYAFKPVSFWFCHDRNGQQRAIVVEVNNTFGERHCYLLASACGTPLGAGRELRATKVFHVSPFCRVEGSYRFRFMNTGARAIARIDHDDADGALLITSMSGQLAVLNASTCLRALFGYPWFTVGVIARIHWQALQLWLKRVSWHRKPEPPSTFTS
jgi:DUF1365 family protein